MLLKALILLFILIKLTSCNNDSFIFNGFRGANLSIDGSAKIMPSGLLILNNKTAHEKGHAFYPLPLHFKQTPLGDTVSFTTTFVFVIVPKYPTLGTSGFTFFLSPSKDFSSAFSNQFFGLFNSTNNGNSANHILAIEFDTAIQPDIGDINANHVGIDINGVRSNKSITAGYISDSDGGFKNLTLISGDPMQVWIEYDGKSTQLNVTLFPLNMPKPLVPLLSTTLDLSSIILDPMYVGFSSSTYKTYSSHYILGWSFKMHGKAQGLDLSSLPAVPRIQTSKKKNIFLTVWLPFCVLVLLSTFLAGTRYFLVRRERLSEILEDWELDFCPQRFSYKDLYQATKGFTDGNLLGVGGFGRVYRGTLPSAKLEVAVKRVSYCRKEGVRQFVAEIAALSKLRHKNLVQLLGYCRRSGELILVYDYIPNGSLDKFIFEERKNLSWEERFQIIKGVASGLLYLHEDCDQIIVHRDVKASNVLLDCNMNARLSDFGLARLYNHGTDPKTTHVVGTIGYIAPELTKNGKATTCTDVFSFGVFLLEVACGRRPIEPTNISNEENLVDWVFSNWRLGRIIETRDRKLGAKFVQEELEMVLKLGLLCSHPVPSARPSMRQVVQFLDGVGLLPDLPSGNVVANNFNGISRNGFCDYVMSYPSCTSGNQVSNIADC